VNVLYVVYPGIGAIIGAQVGAYTNKRLSSRSLNLVFAVMIIVASVNMILKNLHYI